MMPESKKVPRLRFKEFSGEWEEKKLGEVSSIKMNKRIFKDETTSVGEVPFYKISTFGKKATSFITLSKFNEYKSKYSYPNKGDILISASGTLGKTVVYNGERAYYQDSNIIWLDVNKKELINSFLLQFYKIHKWNNIEGSTIKRLYNKDIKMTHISLPKIQEQTKIGEYFSKLDQFIEAQEQKVEQLKQLKRGYLQKMLPQQGAVSPRLRFKEFNSSWKEKSLSKISEIIMGQSPHSKNYTLNPKDNILVQGNADISNGHIAPRIYTTEITKKSSLGSVILTVRAPVGELAINNYNSVVIGRGVASLNSPHNRYLYYYLNNLNIMHYWDKLSAGSTFQSISSNDIRDTKICISEELEQFKICEYFTKLDKLIELQQQKLSKLQQLKKGYLQKMFC